jgi:hypothetical protein
LPANAGESPYPPAPGHENLPVVFWGNYMPTIGAQQLDQNGHIHGASDLHPFMTLAEDSDEQFIRYALDAGLDGFQSCTICTESMYAAARKVHGQTGRMFYINPEWTDLGDTPEKAAKTMADFALAQAKNPHLFRLQGKPMYFFYNHGSWSGSPSGSITRRSDQDSRNVPQVKDLMRKQGVEAWLLPSYFFFDKVALDRQDLLYQSWPAFQPPQPGEPQWLPQTAWDGQGNWTPGDMRPDVAAALHERLKAAGGRFLFIPCVWPGYDSSNRAAQAIHTAAFGLRTLRDNLRMWVTMGYRQINFITWNDINETAMLPSSRSPFGFSRVIRYYRQLAEDGTSPFAAPTAVVAYDPEVLYGEQLSFQFLNLPEKHAFSSDYLCTVRLENLDGSEVTTLTTRVGVPDERTDALTEARFDTTPLIGKAEVLSPVVSVTRVGSENNERKPVFTNLRLPPIALRSNKLRYYTPYAIALDCVAPDGAVTLAADGQQAGLRRATTGDVVAFRAQTKLDTPLRRLSLAESRLTCGTFRDDDTAAALGERNVHLFLRVRCEYPFTYGMALSEGRIRDCFTHDYLGRIPRMTVRIEAPTFEGNSFPHGRPDAAEWHGIHFGNNKPVYRLEAPLDAKVSLSLPGAAAPFAETTLAELAKAPLTVVAPDAGVKGAVRLELATDGAEFNCDYPLPPGGDYVRSIPVFGVGDATRYFHAWALTADDQVAYSRPVVLVRGPATATDAVVADTEAAIPVPLIRTGGVFDDFVDSMTGRPINPFTPADVVVASFPARQIPYYLYDCFEGSGDMLNDMGVAHQLGRAWLSPTGCTWIADGWRGAGLRLTSGTMHLKSKSWPHGAYTFSARVRLAAPSAAPAAAVTTSAGGRGEEQAPCFSGIAVAGLRIDVAADGTVRMSENLRHPEATAASPQALVEGWNHVVVTHDLRTLRLFLNGQPAGEAALATPTYKRTHSTPTIAFVAAAQPAASPATPRLTGALDQVEIIGTALTPEAVASLHEKGQWLAR